MSASASTVGRFIGQAAVWGTSFLLIKVALESFSPYQVVTLRILIAALLLLAVVRLHGDHLARGWRGPSGWLSIGISALLALVIPYWLLSAGETTVPASTAGTLIGATPLLTLTLGRLQKGGERVGVRRGLGFGLGFVGLLVILQPWTTAGASLGGLLACVGAALSYAAGYVYADVMLTRTAAEPSAERRKLTTLGLAASQLVAATVLLVVVFPFAGLTPVSIQPGPVLAAVALGLGASGVATLWYFQLVAAIGPANASAVDYLVPVFAVVAGAVFLGEHIPPALLGGGVVMLLGLALAEGRIGRAQSSETQ